MRGSVRMVKLKKVAVDMYAVYVDGKEIGVAFINYKGMYEIELPNRTVIKAVNQRALKEMVANNI